MKYNLSIFSALFLCAFVSSAFSQESSAPVQPSSEIHQEMKQDSQQIRAQNKVIHADRAKMKQDVQQFGEGSPQVQADRDQLGKDIAVRKSLKRDRREKRRELGQSSGSAPAQAPAQVPAQPAGQ